MSDPSDAEVMDSYGIEEPAPRRLVKTHQGDWVDDLLPSDPDMWDRLEDQSTAQGREAQCLHCGAPLFVYGDNDAECRRCLEGWGEA